MPAQMWSCELQPTYSKVLLWKGHPEETYMPAQMWSCELQPTSSKVLLWKGYPEES